MQILAVNVWVAIALRAADKKIASRLAFCAVMSALCVALFVIGRVISITDYAIAAFCSLIIGVIVIETDKTWALLTYIVVSMLGMLVAAGEGIVVFAVFIGYYPLIKPRLDKYNKLLGISLKLLAFNITVIAAYLLLNYFQFIPFEEIEMLGKYTAAVILIMANGVFLLFDYCFNGIMSKYYSKLHPRVSKILNR